MTSPSRRTVVLSAVLAPILARGQNSRPEQPAIMSAKSALLVLDAQVGVLAPICESSRVVGNLEHLVRQARVAGAPIIWVRHADDEELKYGSDAWKLAPNFTPAPGELLVDKKYNSAFASTVLDARLRAMGVKHLVLAGAATNWCIRATAYAAVDRGYDLTLVSDAHSTESIEIREGFSVTAESMITDLNITFKWLAAPGVKTEVQKTQAVTF